MDNQIIKPDLTCDFLGLVPGTEQYVKAEFAFSDDWRGYTKVVSFRSMLGHEYEPQLLNDGKSCMVPSEALKKRSFKIQVIGKNKELKITTNKLTITQNGGNK